MHDRREIARLLLGSAVGSTLPLSNALAQPVGSRRDEVVALREFAERTHPRGWEARSDPIWQARWMQLEQNADRLFDGAYFVETRRALGWFRDGHTTVLPFEFTGGVPAALKDGLFGLSLPFRVRVFDEGAFVVATTQEVSFAAGARVERIASLSSGSLIAEAAKDWPGSKAWAHRWAGLPFSRPALLQGFGAIGESRDPVHIGLSLGGRTEQRALRPSPSATLEYGDLRRNLSRLEQAAQAAKSANFVWSVPQARAVCIKVDEMADTLGKTFEALTRDCVAAIETTDCERLVIDLRNNGGGNNYLSEPLRRIVAASRFNRTGGLYVLVGPRTFSAAQNFANRLERETYALFVGTPTGGAPNHFGDAASFVGKATGLTSIVSTLPWFDSYPQDKRPWIMPDLLVPELFDDWRSGRDPALDVALSHRPDRQVDQMDPDRVFYFTRKSQSVDWRPFWDRTVR